MPYDKETKKEYDKKRYELKKEQIKEKHRQYRQTPRGLMVERISKWKRRGLICDDYNEIYDIYINTNFCDVCDIPLIEGLYGVNRKVLDHSHITGEFRNVLCTGCNTRRG